MRLKLYKILIIFFIGISLSLIGITTYIMKYDYLNVILNHSYSSIYVVKGINLISLFLSIILFFITDYKKRITYMDLFYIFITFNIFTLFFFLYKALPIHALYDWLNSCIIFISFVTYKIVIYKLKYKRKN